MTKEELNQRRDELAEKFYNRTGYVPTAWAINNFYGGFDQGFALAMEEVTKQDAIIYDLSNEVLNLEAKLEILRMQLVACGVAAIQNTEKSKLDRITKDNPYYSASYKDVCDAVDREIDLRAKLEIVVETLEFYAEFSNWYGEIKHRGNNHFTDFSRTDLEQFEGHMVCGKRARQALKEFKARSGE